MGRRRGQTLLEIVFATAVFALALVAISGLVPIVMRASRRSQNVVMATQLAQGMIEATRGAPFPVLNNSYTDWNKNQWNAASTYLPASYNGYPNVLVGGATYTCNLQVVALTYHPDDNTPNNPDDETPRLKQITATVSWDPTVPSVVLTEAAYDNLPQ